MKIAFKSTFKTNKSLDIHELKVNRETQRKNHNSKDHEKSAQNFSKYSGYSPLYPQAIICG